MGQSREELDDSDWGEVFIINSYAVFMSYLSMAIKGLGFLILTWTTVVLLGGFVSMLHKKDFWCLTFITLVQMAGICDVVLNEKLSDVRKSPFALIWIVLVGVVGDRSDGDLVLIGRVLLACVLTLIQLLLFAVVLCPLATIYMFGMLMSGGISLWRLIEHDYMDSHGEASNLSPAMDTLYYLALLQGVLFCYRFILGQSEKGMAKMVAYTPNLSTLQVIHDYLSETRRGCEKDPSFAKGRNLVTHAIDMIGCNSPFGSIRGVDILYTAITIAEDNRQRNNNNSDMKNDIVILIKHLVKNDILQKLLEMLNSRGIHETYSRHHAGVIVEHLASDINLEQFPQAIEHISSMIETSEQTSIAQLQCQRDNIFGAPKYKELLLKGLCILRKLAAHQYNCRVISYTPDLVSKIMAPVTSDLLDHTTADHGAWSDIVEAAMEVMILLTSTPGEVGAKLRHEISRREGAISTFWRIINCDKCNHNLHVIVIRILTELYIDTQTSIATVLQNESSSCREDFVRKLVDNFTKYNKSIDIRIYSGIALSDICSRGGGSAAIVVIQESAEIVDNLTKVLVHDKNEKCRQAAAEILEHLCSNYTRADEYLLKAMVYAFPKVIEQIILYAAKTQEGEDRFAEINLVRTVTLLSSLLSLSGTVISKFGLDLAPQFNASTFPYELKGIVLNLLRRKTMVTGSLSLFKTIAKIVISLMKHSGDRFAKQDLEALIDTLSGASKEIQNLDYSMVFCTANSETTSSKLNRCTLLSLVKESREHFATLER